MTFVYFGLGLFFWTIVEYVFHRFGFHGEDKYLADSTLAFALHFLIHGIHHAFPQDKLRLVFPPILALPIYQYIFKSVFLSFPAFMNEPVMAGAVFGYVAYDMIHYYLHHNTPLNEYWHGMKIYHMQHHYKNGRLGFGVSQKLWDIVFGTELK